MFGWMKSRKTRKAYKAMMVEMSAKVDSFGLLDF